MVSKENDRNAPGNRPAVVRANADYPEPVTCHSDRPPAERLSRFLIAESIIFSKHIASTKTINNQRHIGMVYGIGRIASHALDFGLTVIPLE